MQLLLPSTFPQPSRTEQAALFQNQLKQAEEAEKKVALGSNVWIGQDVMTEEAVAEAQRLRDDQHKHHQLHTERNAMRR
jgi:hypothetical protein